MYFFPGKNVEIIGKYWESLREVNGNLWEFKEISEIEFKMLSTFCIKYKHCTLIIHI